MDREIKFRVWNERYKEFTYWGFVDHGFKGIPTGSGLTIDECAKISQQFTGLHDKNGVEIYEGDISKTDNGHIVEIRWDFCSEKTDDWDFEYTGFCMHNHKLKRNFHLDKGHDLTVIGNIYQHPKLLKQEPVTP